MRYLMALCLLATVFLACGGDDGGTGPKTKDEGSVFVQNSDSGLSLTMTVTLVDGHPPTQDDLPSDMVPGEAIEIPTGSPVRVTGNLAGGTEVQLHFLLNKRRNMEDDKTVTVDGSRLVVFGPETNIENRFIDYQERPY